MKTPGPVLAFALPLRSSAPTWAQTAPATWTEHGFEHNQTVSRVYQDKDVAMYFDSAVNRSITWPNTFVGDVTAGTYNAGCHASTGGWNLDWLRITRTP